MTWQGWCSPQGWEGTQHAPLGAHTPESAWCLEPAEGWCRWGGVEGSVAPQDMATTVLGFRLTEPHSRDHL